MTDPLPIQPVTGPIVGTATPPGSKSITNRAMVCAALAAGPCELTGVLESEDTRVMADALSALGIGGQVDWPNCRMTLAGCGGNVPAKSAELYVANSGTTVRFLTALCALGSGRYQLDGTARMRERPIQDLLDTLAQLGVETSSQQGNGCPPVVVHGRGLAGGQAAIRGDISSQFLSALLMVAPYARQPLTLKIDGPLVSQPYVHMTLAVMREFGIDVPAGDLKQFAVVAPRCYHRAAPYAIEPDASAASYFWAAAAITGGRVTVPGLNQHSLQGDVAFCDCLAQMGCQVKYEAAGTTVVGTTELCGIDVDMNAISDTVQTLGAVAVFAKGPTRVRAVGHIRHKETDRIHALAVELRKFGAQVEEHDDGLTIVPPPRVEDLHGATIDTYHDHRMAMSLALVGLRVPGVLINDPDCTGKTYPSYFEDLARLCGNS